jgi:hypothetical protein
MRLDDGDNAPSDANRYSKDVGKTVWFNWGRHVHKGKLLAWDAAFQKATIRMLYMGKEVTLELKVGRTTGFAVESPVPKERSPSRSRATSAAGSTTRRTSKTATPSSDGGGSADSASAEP